MYGTLISFLALVISIGLLFVNAKYFGKCWLYPRTMVKQQKRYNVVKGILNTFIWLSIVALIISLIVWYYQWGLERADNVVFVL